MAVDPNVYALQINLALDTADAFAEVDKFENAMMGTEKAISDVALKSIGKVSELITSINDNIGSISGTFSTIGKDTTSLSTNLSAALDNSTNIDQSLDDQIKNLQKILDNREELRDLNEEIVDFAKDELDNANDYIKTLKNIKTAIKDKNKGHSQELDLVETEGPMLEDMADQWGDIDDKVGSTTKQHRSLFSVLRQMFSFLQQFDKETENFVTTNYRWYGSQQDITQQTRMLSMEYGILREKSLEAYKVLGDLRMPREELDKYARTVAEANRYLGVSINTLGMYAQRMRQVGMDAAGMERQTRFASEAMRKLGLSTDDLNKILGGTALSAAELESMFRGENQAEKYDQLRMVMAGLGKQAGYTADQTSRLFDQLADPHTFMMFEALAGQSINSVEDMAMAFNAAGKEIDAKMDQLEAAHEAGALSTIDLRMEQQALANAYKLGSVQNMLMIRRLKEQADAMGITISSVEDYKRVMEAMQKSALDPYAEANNTLTMQLDMLRSSIMAMVGHAIQPLADGLRDVLIVVNNWIVKFAEMYKAVHVWWADLVKAHPWLESVAKYLKMGAGAAVILIGSLVALGGAFGMIRGLISVITSGIKSFFGAIGSGLQTLGNSVKSVMVPLLALGAAFMMTGVGAYLFAKSVMMVATLGWQAIPAILGMIVAIGLLGATLVILAAFVQGPIALGLVILAGAFVAVGLAALMTGYGIKLAAEGFQIFVNVLMQLMDINLVEFGAKLMATALVIWNASLMLMAAGGMLILAVGSIVLGAGMMITAAVAVGIGAGALALTGGLLSAAALTFKTTTFMIGGVADTIKDIGTKVGAGGTSLLRGVVAVNTAAASLGSTGSKLKTTGKSLSAALGYLDENVTGKLQQIAVRLSFAGGWLMSGGRGLYYGSQFLGSVANILLKHSSDVGKASGILLPSSIKLMQSGENILLAGRSYYSGGLMLRMGANAVLAATGRMWDMAIIGRAIGADLSIMAFRWYDSAKMMYESGSILVVASNMLVTGSRRLLSMIPFIDQLVSVSASLSNVSDSLQPAAIKLYGSMSWLESSINRFSTVAPRVRIVAGSVLMLANAFGALQAIPSGSLLSLANDSETAMPAILSFSAKLSTAATRLDAAVTKFEGPTHRLVAALSSIKDVLSDSDLQGIVLESQIAEIGTELEKYATALESAAQRVETAVTAKALPAINKATTSGISDVAKSEAITTVQVMDQREGGAPDEKLLVAQLQVTLLQRLIELLEPISGNGEYLPQLLELLESNLPGLSDKETSLLASEMNQWMQ